jgi:putative transposase
MALAFTVAYVFVIMEIASRRIVHANVTTSPTLPWVQQQVREATPTGTTPRFLVHDNDAIYGQYRPPVRAERNGGPCRYRCHLDRWLQEAMAITGIPIPYGAPNASPHVERFMRTLRQEALDHFVFLSVAHLRRVVHAYVTYYNGAQPSQAIHSIPAPYPELRDAPPAEGTIVALPVLSGLHHDYRLAA